MDQEPPKRRISAPYNFLVTLPDRIYPFSSYVDGERVRWRRSYEHTLSDIQERLGEGRYGARLVLYREICHVAGAGILILSGTYLSQYFWGNDVALPVLFILAMGVITYQEFVLQPRTHKQRIGKGILDWLSWAAPFTLYIFLFVK